MDITSIPIRQIVWQIFDLNKDVKEKKGIRINPTRGITIKVK